MKYPLLCNLLRRKYPAEAFEEILSGKDLLPFPTKEKQRIISNFSETIEPKLMNGDNLMQAVCYDSALRNIFKHRDDDEYYDGVRASVYCNELLNEMKDCLKNTNPKHLGKHHRPLISLMISIPNLPEKMLLDLIEKSDLKQKDMLGHTPLDAACASMIHTNPVNKAAVLSIYEKSGITDVKQYEDKIKKEHNTAYAQVVGHHTYIEGFKKIQALSLELQNKNKNKSTGATV